MLELALRLRIGGLEAAERLLDLRCRPLWKYAHGGFYVGRYALGR